MKFPLQQLVISGVVGYIAWELYTIYAFCQPPLALEGAGDGVAWDLRDREAVDIRLFLSLDGQASPSALEKAESKSHILVGEFSGISPVSSAAVPDLQIDGLNLPKAFFKNKTVFLHALAMPRGAAGASPLRHEVSQISRFSVQPDRRIKKEYLLGGPPRGVQEENREAELAVGSAPLSSLPKVIEVGFVNEVRLLDATGLKNLGLSRHVSGAKVRLPLYVNTLVSPRDEYMPLLQGGKPPSMELRFRSIGLAYWTMQQQIGNAFDEAERSMGMNEYDVDSFKQMVGGSSPLKILLVYSVSIMHLIFEYLAFSADLSFWRTKTSFEGLSASSVTLQACMNIIMFLYVKEQRQTKFVMYFIAFRFCLQLWKLRKLTTFRRCPGFPYVRWVNRAGAAQGLEELEDVHTTERKCMVTLLLVLLPVIAAFCAYRLVYERFRSWYSWIVLSLAICAQMGGFVVMTPQVFMNYRLKSVEHLPWKALTYQAINTFIDDIFMLCIRMPEIQKYSVFRDDIIFVICCVQRWLYTKPSVAVADAGAEGALPAVSNPGNGSADCAETPVAEKSTQEKKAD